MSLSSVVSINTPETGSTRRVEKVTGSHRFKIHGYSLEKDKGNENFIDSATFSVGGYDWSIQYYPNGDARIEDDYTSIYIYLKSEAECVKAQTSNIICSQNGDPLSNERSTICTFSSGKNCAFGFSKFVKRAAFESLLKDDCLVIRCTVTVFRAFPVEVEPAYPIHVPPPDVQQLSHLLEDGYGVDVTFEVNGQTFNAHKCILAARSRVFRAQFYGPFKEALDTNIKIEDIEAPVFKTLLHYIYSETVPEFDELNEGEKKHNTKLMAQHLLAAADRYGLERLKIICESFLYGTIDRSNVAALLSLADMHNCIHLKTACLKFIASPEILSEVVATEEFQCLVRNHPLILKELFVKRVG